jgi:hypothetical protein
VQDEVIYRCIHAACARQLPRKVNFCPYCGTGQHAGVDKPSHAAPKVVMPAPPPQPAPAAAVPPAPPSSPSPPSPPSPPPPPPPAPTPAPPRAAYRAPVGTAAPPKRQPLQLRYWALAAALLWAIWITAKPTSKKIDARIDQAIALSKECKSGEAQAELIALRSTKATPEQLQRLQQAINAEAPLCDRKRLRSKAWTDTVVAVDAALESLSPEKALARLNQFIKRWGEDSASRELGRKVDERKGDSARAQSARNLIAEGGRALSLGDYKTAIDKMEVCAAMVEGGNRECEAMRVRAERLQRDMTECLRRGGEWMADRCQ